MIVRSLSVQQCSLYNVQGQSYYCFLPGVSVIVRLQSTWVYVCSGATTQDCNRLITVIETSALLRS